MRNIWNNICEISRKLQNPLISGNLNFLLFSPMVCTVASISSLPPLETMPILLKVFSSNLTCQRAASSCSTSNIIYYFAKDTNLLTMHQKYFIGDAHYKGLKAALAESAAWLVYTIRACFAIRTRWSWARKTTWTPWFPSPPARPFTSSPRRPAGIEIPDKLYRKKKTDKLYRKEDGEVFHSTNEKMPQAVVMTMRF